jgi:hypothetical protein
LNLKGKQLSGTVYFTFSNKNFSLQMDGKSDMLADCILHVWNHGIFQPYHSLPSRKDAENRRLLIRSLQTRKSTLQNEKQQIQTGVCVSGCKNQQDSLLHIFFKKSLQTSTEFLKSALQKSKYLMVVHQNSITMLVVQEMAKGWITL